MQLEAGISAQTYFAFWILNFALISFCFVEHTWGRQFTALYVKFGQLPGARAWSSWSGHWSRQHPLSFIRSLTKTSLKFQWECFRPQVMRGIKTGLSWKAHEVQKQLFCPFLCMSSNGVTVWHEVAPYLIPHISVTYSLVQWLASECFHIHHRNYFLLEDDACFSADYILFPFQPVSVGLPFTLVLCYLISVWASF